MTPEASSHGDERQSTPRSSASQGCDLAAIRAALAAANRRDFANQALHEKNHLYENAPTWLAALCDEVERQQSFVKAWETDNERLRHENQRQRALLGERVLAAAEIGRDAALAENERLRNSIEELHIAWGNEIESVVEARRIADLCRTAIAYSSHRGTALDAHDARSWRPDA